MVDIDNAELYKINVRPDIAVCADAKEFIGLLLKHKELLTSKHRKAWFDYGETRI